MNSYSMNINNIAAGRVHESSVVASIDELKFVTRSRFDSSSLLTDAKKVLGRDGYIKSLPGLPSQTVYFFESLDGGYRFKLNPSYFSSAWSCLDSIESLLGRVGLEAHITSLTATLTIPCDFYSFYMGLDFGLKRVIC